MLSSKAAKLLGFRCADTDSSHSQSRPYTPWARALRDHKQQRNGTAVRSSNTWHNMNCNICHEQIRDPSFTPCNHFYCYECLSEWLVRSPHCPDCRQSLVRPQQIIPFKPAASKSTRYSSSQWVFTTTTKESLRIKISKECTGPDPQELSKRLYAILQTSPGLDASSLSSESTPSTPARKAFRPWCLQKRTPLRNRAAHPWIQRELELTTPRAESPLSCRTDTPMLSGSCDTQATVCTTPNSKDRVIKAKASSKQPGHRRMRSVSLLLPGQIYQLQHHHISTFNGMVTVDTEKMLSHLRHMKNSIANDPTIPRRCKAAAKCVWREWQESLASNEGRHLCTDDLLEMLLKTFETTIVDYGWASDWRKMPDAFVEAIEQASRAVVYGGTMFKHTAAWGLI